MKPLQLYPLLNFKETSAKDIFLRRLKGLPVNFGFIPMEDKGAFIDFAVLHNLLVFLCHKEYRGILARYNALEDFSFYVDREDAQGQQFLTLGKGDTIEITELYPINQGGGYRVHPGHSVVNEIYIYVTDEERAKFYAI